MVISLCNNFTEHTYTYIQLWSCICTCYSEQYNASQSGVIISSQISKELIELPDNGNVQLKFHNVSTCVVVKIIQLHDVNNSVIKQIWLMYVAMCIKLCIHTYILYS